MCPQTTMCLPKIFGHLQIQNLPEQSYNERAACKKRSGADIDLPKKQNLAYLTFVKEKNWLMLNLVKLEKSNGKEEQGRRPHNTTLIRT